MVQHNFDLWIDRVASLVAMGKWVRPRFLVNPQVWLGENGDVGLSASSSSGGFVWVI